MGAFKQAIPPTTAITPTATHTELHLPTPIPIPHNLISNSPPIATLTTYEVQSTFDQMPYYSMAPGRWYTESLYL